MMYDQGGYEDFMRQRMRGQDPAALFGRMQGRNWDAGPPMQGQGPPPPMPPPMRGPGPGPQMQMPGRRRMMPPGLQAMSIDPNMGISGPYRGGPPMRNEMPQMQQDQGIRNLGMLENLLRQKLAGSRGPSGVGMAVDMPQNVGAGGGARGNMQDFLQFIQRRQRGLPPGVEMGMAM